MKSVLITGASKGIGKTLAISLKNQGYNIIGTYNSSFEKAKELEENYSIEMIKCDVKNDEDLKNVYEVIESKYKNLYAVINNAGISYENLLQDTSFFDIQNIINTNLVSIINSSKYATKLMLKEKNGVIINMSSIWGINGASFETVYSASKGGVISFTKALAKEIGPSGIRVNAISPGVIKTDMLNAYTNEELLFLRNDTPLLKLGTTEDVLNAVEFLLNEKSKFITGENIVIDGGFSL